MSENLVIIRKVWAEKSTDGILASILYAKYVLDERKRGGLLTPEQMRSLIMLARDFIDLGSGGDSP